MGSDVRRVRPLYDWEIQEAYKIFGDSFSYGRVRIHEGARWPDMIDRIGRKLKRLPPLETHNAITLGNHCYFPVALPETLGAPTGQEHSQNCWLMHELTHAWQYQHMGWRYLFKALSAQFRLKAGAYDFGKEEGLKMRRKEGWTFHKFNLEQQGDIVSSYYNCVRKGLDDDPYLPYIKDIQALLL